MQGQILCRIDGADRCLRIRSGVLQARKIVGADQEGQGLADGFLIERAHCPDIGAAMGENEAGIGPEMVVVGFLLGVKAGVKIGSRWADLGDRDILG